MIPVFSSAICLTSLRHQTPAQQGGHESNVNPKDMQIQLTGFLGAEPAMLFMKDLWLLLLSAQVSPPLLPAAAVMFPHPTSTSGELQAQQKRGQQGQLP